MSRQLPGRPVVTDGGLETDLIFHHGVDLPYFAAFPLLDSEKGRSLLTGYYDGYAAIAERARAALMLESATWRASSDWGKLLGYSEDTLARVNRDAIAMLVGLRDKYCRTVTDVVVGGSLGPRGDGYRPDRLMDPAEAADYHGPQIEAFAQAGADVVTAYTITHAGEAIGIVRAARAVGLPVAISFTVETDGRLPSGDSLKTAVTTVDEEGGPGYFLVNCAHPTHVSAALAEDGDWRKRIAGLRCNASTKSHAELDEASQLDEGDLRLLTKTHELLKPLLPNLSIVGGCCGTDARHVAALWGL